MEKIYTFFDSKGETLLVGIFSALCIILLLDSTEVSNFHMPTIIGLVISFVGVLPITVLSSMKKDKEISDM